jgi:lipoprotein-releasing system permease protein
MVGVAIGTMALIIVLSVFNGLQDILKGIYGTFDPDLKIEKIEGKTFSLAQETIDSLKQIQGVTAVVPVIEENVVLSYQNTQSVVRLKGVANEFLTVQKLDTFLVTGETKFYEGGKSYALFGIGVAYQLGVLTDSDLLEVQAIFPRKLRAGSLPNAGSLTKRKLHPSGIFQIEQNFDEKYVITSLDFVESLTGYKNRLTSLELFINDESDINRVILETKEFLGNNYRVLTSEEQHAQLLNAVRIEKLFVYVALSFITAIASFNIFFCLSMLAIEKRKDISILLSLGLSPKRIAAIFLKQGGMIAFSGAFLGISLGVILCLVQQKFGLIGMGMSTSLIQAYPVKLQGADVILVAFSMIIITLITSFRPAILASKTEEIKYIN